MAWREDLLFRDCPWCNASKASFVLQGRNDDVVTSAHSLRAWAFASCPNCGGAVLIEYQRPHNIFGAVRVVPDGAENNIQVDHLPERVRGNFEDAQKALAAGIDGLSAVALRRTIEAASREKGVESGSLVSRIKKLKKLGFVTTDFEPAVDYVRQIGNIGAHDTDDVIDHQTIERAMKFTTQLLRNLFEIPGELALIQPEATEEEQVEDTEAA